MTKQKHIPKRFTAPEDGGEQHRWQVRVHQCIADLAEAIEAGEREGWVEEPELAEALLEELRQTIVGVGGSEAVAKVFGSTRQWVEECRRLVLRRWLLAAPVMPFFCDSVRANLSRIDARAANLTDDQIGRAFRERRIKDHTGTAARLAVDCGAFNFEHYRDAKSHFWKMR